MPFRKSLPKQDPKGGYPRWIDVELTADEEMEQEELSRKRNRELMKQCTCDAVEILVRRGFKPYQGDIIKIATALFNKRAVHENYWKERKCKEKFLSIS